MMAVTKGPWPNDRAAPFEPFSPSKWQGDPPAHDWMVDGCLLKGTVSMLSGDGGLGKSLLLQQLLTAAALGLDWLGLPTKHVKVFGVFCEDDESELWRRQAAINRHYRCDMGDLENMMLVSRVGDDNILMDFPGRSDRGVIKPLYQQIEHAVKEFGAQIVGLDTLADFFGGNENIRIHARTFVTLLRRLAISIGGGVMLPAHPSNAGINTGTGVSGNTAWNNTVRGRTYLTRRAPVEEGGDDTERYLKTMKSNYGPGGGKIPLKWSDGVFIRTDQGTGPISQLSKIDLDNRLVEELRTMLANGSRIAAALESNRGFANVMRQRPGFKDQSQGTIYGAQQRMVQSGRLKVISMGPPSSRHEYLRPADMRYPGEKEGQPE